MNKEHLSFRYSDRFWFQYYRKREVERSRNAKLSRKHVSDVPRDHYMEEDVHNQNQHDPA